MKKIFCEKVSSDLGLVAQFYLLVIMEIWPENSTAFYDENGQWYDYELKSPAHSTF